VITYQASGRLDSSTAGSTVAEGSPEASLPVPAVPGALLILTRLGIPTLQD